MGVSCCVREINKNDDLNNCETISDIRDFLANKLELAELEQEEIEIYLNEKNKLPRTIEVEGLNEEDLKKRILYLNEMKECINKIDDLLKTKLIYKMKDWKIKFYENKIFELNYYHFKKFIYIKKNNCNQDLDVIDIKNSMKEFNVMYSYIYDDSKRYMKWFSVFQAFTESNKSKN